MRSDHRKQEAESQKTNCRSDRAPFTFSTKSWRVKSAHRESALLSFFFFFKNVLGQETLMSKHERCFFAWGQIPERMRNQWILKSLRLCIWVGCLKGARLMSHCFNLIFQYNLFKTVQSMSRTNPQSPHRILMCMWASSVWVYDEEEEGNGEDGVNHKIQANCTLHRRYIQTVVSFTCTFTF